MIIGFVGSGNMAAAMARGWAGEFEGMLFSDSGSGRAQQLADELGGDAVSNAEIAQRADLVLLAVKPGKLDEVVPELSGVSRIVSALAVVPLERQQAAFPEAEVLRVMPNVGAEVRKGVLCIAGEANEEVRAKLAVLGHVVEIADADFDEATAIMGCAPAYLALAVEARKLRAQLVVATSTIANKALVDLDKRLRELLRRARLTHIDAVIGKKKKLEIEIANLRQGRFPADLFATLQLEGLMGDDEEYWPFEGEYWSDEYENYK